MPETLRVQHTAYVQNRAHHTDRDCASGQKIPVPTSELSLEAVPTLSQRTSCIGEQCERHRANPSPTYAQKSDHLPRSTVHSRGRAMANPAQLPAVAAPMALDFPAPRPRSPSSTTTEHSTPTKERSLRPCPPPSLRTRADAYMCAFAGACICACGSSPRRSTHALVTSRWAHSRSKPLILSSP